MLNMKPISFQHCFPVPNLVCTGKTSIPQNTFFSFKKKTWFAGKGKYAVNSTIHKITKE